MNPLSDSDSPPQLGSLSQSESQYSDSEIYDEANLIQVSKEFEENVIKFTQYDDLIRTKQEEINELKKKRDPCKKFILDYLDSLGESTIEINGGQLKKNTTESKQPLNHDLIKACIMKEIDNPLLLQKILKHMDEDRQTKEKTDIKRTFDRPVKRFRKKKPLQKPSEPPTGEA